MMPIRREDKEFIQSLSLLGAVLGACLAVAAVMHMSGKAHHNLEEVTEYHQTQAALLKLSQTVVNPNNPIADENVLEQVQQEFQQTPKPKTPEKQSFWVQIPRWGLIGMCGFGLVLGAIAGYTTVMAASWIGTLIVLYLIRLMYLCIRKTAPGYAHQIHLHPKSQNPGTVYNRDTSRILPMLVKMSFLLLLVLLILGAVVWHLTAI